ncbi:MAG: hypothetical protein ACREFL_08440 [Stellaceae bacterium]
MEAAAGDIGGVGAFDYLKLIVWIAAAFGSWGMLIGVSHLARTLMR